jgi:hypothetical protein
MRRKQLLLATLGVVLGLSSAMPSTVAQAGNFMNMMNPARWMGLDRDDDDYYSRRYRYDRYRWGGPWGPYGWGGPPGYAGRTIVIAQQPDPPQPQPEKLPE